MKPHADSEVTRWQQQRDRLTGWYARVKAAPTMHGERWRDGQLAHIQRLLTAHDANKPKGA